ncbi:MAG: 1-deoxy-D-xylulose-5-phosphate synthase [Bacilli bacterium]|nr:1-deoxy-D-xylulose-5-phosphate synthase [Bacilli bacterium]
MLERINSPIDVKKLTSEERLVLADDIRDALIKRVSTTGGHFGPNMGIVDITIALHTVFNSPIDKFVFDVSHQCYTHKMLTGRREGFSIPEHYGDYSGYTSPKESEHDMFQVGHTSTSISLAIGLAKARDLKGENYNVVAIIGDGSLSGGEALEGLNVAGEMDTNLIIVVNDNDMSIAENHGGMYKGLKDLRDSDGLCPVNIFRAMGLDYVFVKDGNNIDKMIDVLNKVKDNPRPVVVHAVTLKGKGYRFAEENKEAYHWHMPFDIATGQSPSRGGYNYTAATVEYLLKKAKEDPTLMVLAAGSAGANGLGPKQREELGKQFLDVGIAEETAVAIASGLAKNGAKPVFPIASTFIQRAYDQISQDVCINKSPITLLIGGASITGARDVTHSGIYDIGMLTSIPNLVYLAPQTLEEYLAMLDWSVNQTEYPTAIRIPVGPITHRDTPVAKDYSAINKVEILRTGKDVAIIAVGNTYPLAKEVAEEVDATLINPRYVSGIDEELYSTLANGYRLIITLEDGSLDGGYGEKVASFLSPLGVKVKSFGIPKAFYDRFDPNNVKESVGLTKEALIAYISNN